MFDEKIVNEEFLDSLHAIAQEPLSERIASSLKPVRLGGVVLLLLLYGNTMFESILKIYWHYYHYFVSYNLIMYMYDIVNLYLLLFVDLQYIRPVCRELMHSIITV